MKRTIAIVLALLAVTIGISAGWNDSRLLAAIAAGFGGLSLLFLLQDHIVRRHMVLGQEELARWGDELAEVTPQLLQAVGEWTHALVIAKSLEAERGIPRDIVLKYIIALGRHHAERGGG